MESEWTFRVLRSSWGVAVTLRAEAVAGPLENSVRIGSALFLRVDAWRPVLNAGEHGELERGVRIVTPQIQQKHGGDLLTVRIVEVSFSECDFQPEGLACAAMGWAAQAFGFEAPDVPVSFDRAANRYFFRFPELPEA